MDALSTKVAGLFRRGLPTGEQRELVIAWVAAELAKDGTDAKGMIRELASTLERVTARLTDRR